MLGEMRGCDGNMNGWNSGHGNGAGARGFYMIRKFEVGAYVVNSDNWTGGFDGYNQVENEMDTAYPSSSHYKTRRPEVQNRWQRQPMVQKESVSNYPRHGYQSDVRQAEPAILQERRLSGYNPPSHQASQNWQEPSGHMIRPTNSENHWSSVCEELMDGFDSGNIYEGTMVRVKVPEVYSEVGAQNGSMRNSGTTITYPSQNETKAQYLPSANELNNYEIYGGEPVAADTYKRINDWLRSCHQHTGGSPRSSHSGKSTYSSQKLNITNAERSNPQQMVTNNSVSGHSVKPNYGVSVQAHDGSNFKFAKEPRIVAALESKPTRTSKDMHSANNCQRNRNLGWAESSEHTYHHDRQTSGFRNVDVTSAYSFNANNASSQLGRSQFDSGFSKTSSEWSSETLSILGSDASSYCTAFTPFELGQNFDEERCKRNAASAAASSRLSGVGKNLFVSHVSVDKVPQKENAVQENDYPQVPRKPLGNAVSGNRWNNQSKNYNKSVNLEPKSEQCQLQNRYVEEKARTAKNMQINLNSPKDAHVATVFVGHTQKPPQDHSGTDHGNSHNMETQNYADFSAEPVQDFKFSETRAYKDARRNVITGDSKPFKDKRKVSLVLESVPAERPRSFARFIEKDQPLSLVGNNKYQREALNQERPVTQLRTGSLSITIRPKCPTIVDFFNKSENKRDSAHAKVESSQPKYDDLSFDEESIHDEPDNHFKDAVESESRGSVHMADDAGSDCSDVRSKGSEELDAFTKTFIKADVPGKMTTSSGRAEYPPPKPYYNALKHRPVKACPTSLLADVQNKLATKAYQRPEDGIAVEADSRTDVGVGHSTNRNDLLQKTRLVQPEARKQSKESRVVSGLFMGSSTATPWSEKISPVKSAKISPEKTPKNEKFSYTNDLDRQLDYKNYHQGGSLGARVSPGNQHSELPASPNKPKGKGFEVHYFERNPTGFGLPASYAGKGAAGSDSSFSNNRCKETVPGIESGTLPPQPDLIKCTSVQGFRPGSENKISEDLLLMSLLQNQSQDLPEFHDFSTPCLQTQNLVHTSHFTIRSKCTEDAAEASLKWTAGEEFQPDSVAKGPKDHDTSKVVANEVDLQEGVKSSHTKTQNFESLTGSKMCNVFEFPQGTSNGCKEFQDDECLDNFLTGFSESASLVSEVMSALADLKRKESEVLDSKIDENVDTKQSSEGLCSKTSKEAVDSSFTEHETKKDMKEAMSCQEFIDFPENHIIDPPESFCDFTIML